MSKRPSTGVIVAIASAVVVAGGGAYAALTMSQGAAPPGIATNSPTAGDPMVSVQSDSSGQLAGPPTRPIDGAVTTPPASSGSMPALADKGGGLYELKDKAIELSLKLPDAAAGNPVLTPLLDDAGSSFRSAYDDAHDAYAAASNDDAALSLFPYSQSVTWTYTARAGDFVSLSGVMSDWSGGAHPNYTFDTLISRATGKKLAFEDMLQGDRIPSPALTIGVCEGLKAEKRRKGISVDIMGEPIVCAGPNANVTPKLFALAPSSDAGKFGGVYVYFAPYEVGSYAEGSFTITVQQVVFAEDLRPEYRKLFGGTAPPEKN